MNRLISTGFSPNVESDDLKLVVELLSRPWKWKSGQYSHSLQESIKTYLKVKHAYTFDSGRTSLLMILESLNLKSGDEILIQAYTCVAVPDAIIWAGLRPIYVDINADFNMSFIDLQKKISNKTKAIIVQHTFGLPADIERISKFAKKNHLYLIEDCAHSLGGSYKNEKLGTLADAAILSFGRDKVISSVFGGMVVTNNEKLANKIAKYQQEAPVPKTIWIFVQLLHPLLTQFIKTIYPLGPIGKIVMKSFNKLKILSKAVSSEEKSAKKPFFVGKKMPNALACLASHQMSKIDKFNRKRANIAKLYFSHLKGLPITLPSRINSSYYLRFTLITEDSKSILGFMKRKNIFLGDWYTHPIAPAGVNYLKIHYKIGSCPNAERLAKLTINLPTSPNMSFDDAVRVAIEVKNFYEIKNNRS